MYIKVKVFPKSKKEKIAQIDSDRFEIWVKEKAERNQANWATINLLSQYLNIPLGRIRLVKGRSERNKIFQIKE